MRNNRLPRQIEDDPEGWVSLRRAFLRVWIAVVGRAARPEDVEADIERGALPPILTADVAEAIDGEIELQGGSAFYTMTVCKIFAQAVRAGRLAVQSKPKGAGEMCPMPLVAWETDSPFLRFRGWSYDPEVPGASGLRLSHWVLVRRADLEAFVEGLTAWRESLPELDLERLPAEGLDCLLPTPAHVERVDECFVVSPPSVSNIKFVKPRLAVVEQLEKLSPKDRDIIEKMHRLIVERGMKKSPAALALADEYKPGGAADDARRTLARIYERVYPEQP